MKNPFPLLAFLTLFALGMAARAQNQAIYTDSLQNGWQNYGWATLNYANPKPVQSGTDSISVTASAYQALYLGHAAQDTTPYKSLSFWIDGGAGGQKLQVQATLSGSPQTAYPLGPLAANTWQQVNIPLTTLGVADNPLFDGFWIQDTTGTTQPAYYVDTISLISGTSVIPPNAAVSVAVDATAQVHAINPLIYGVAYGTQPELIDLRAPLNRLGGDNMTRYNWDVNGDNRANDYYFESIGDTSAVAGERGDTFISTSKAGAAYAMITIPMIPWVAKLGPGRAKLDSFSVAKYGAQQATDPYWADAGNGIRTSGTDITGNNPTDANTPNSTTLENGWIQHIVSTWGKGVVRYYIMDNEPSIWFQTHRDVAPTGLKMASLEADILAYSALVRAADPTAKVVGPEEWGWEGYFYSGYDQQYTSLHGYSTYPDRAAHGNMDYLPWLLSALHANDIQKGTRSLDVFSVHYYPQSGEFSDDITPATQLLRNESTRELWDPNYVSKSWINSTVELIPRLQSWVKTYYPGLKTAITEYNWGAEGSINGATAQADIDGILGREGLDMATRWTVPDPSTPTYLAMKMYRNYDGKGSAFGGTSVSATAPNPDNLSAFAALRATDGALTVMVICKVLSGVTPVTLNLAHFTPGTTAQAWQLTSANAIRALPNITLAGTSLKANLPSQSITLFVIPPATVSN